MGEKYNRNNLLIKDQRFNERFYSIATNTVLLNSKML